MLKSDELLFQKTYFTVAPVAVEYFKKVWIERNKLSERQFRNRLKNPKLDDILLFIHVCKLDLATTLKPFQEKFKNVPQYNTNLQLTIES